MTNPLMDTVPAKIRLKSPPLVRVIAAAQFSPVLSIDKADYVAPFQESIRQDYPGMEESRAQAIKFQIIEGIPRPEIVSQPVWHFVSKDDSWRVSLSREQLSIETKRSYVDRDDLLRRLKALSEAIAKFIQPAQIIRLGLRYVNLVPIPDTESAERYIRPEIGRMAQGWLGHALRLAQNHAELNVPEGLIIVRSGVVLKGSTHDPNVCDQVDSRSFYLDLDAVKIETVDFSVDYVEEYARKLAGRVSSVFQWAVTEEFLRDRNS